MAKKPDPYLNNRVAQICGLCVAVYVLVSPLIRLVNGSWSKDDWVPLVLGILLTATWLVIITLGWRQRRRDRDESPELGSE